MLSSPTLAPNWFERGSHTVERSGANTTGDEECIGEGWGKETGRSKWDSCGDSGLGRLAGKSHPAPPTPLGEIWFGASQFLVIIVSGSSSSIFG